MFIVGHCLPLNFFFFKLTIQAGHLVNCSSSNDDTHKSVYSIGYSVERLGNNFFHDKSMVQGLLII